MTSKLMLGFAMAVLTTFLMPVSEALAICCGGSCCLIDGTCYNTGDTNPGNECQSCDPSSSQTAWTDTPDCASEDAGMSMPDAGGPPLPEDAGAPAEEDAGAPPAVDAGAPETDAGTADDDSRSDDGCAAGGSGAFGGLFGLLLLALRRKKEER